MKAFNFRYSKILDYRRYLEKKAQTELNAVRQELLAIEQGIRRNREQRIQLEQECNEAGSKGLTVPIYRLYQNYMLTLDRAMERARLEFNKSLQKVKRQEKRLKAEMIKRKTLEKLEEIAYQAHITKAWHAEQKLLDEMVIMRKGKGS